MTCPFQLRKSTKVLKSSNRFFVVLSIKEGKNDTKGTWEQHDKHVTDKHVTDK